MPLAFGWDEPAGRPLFDVQVEQSLDFVEDIAEDILGPYVLGVVGFPRNMTDEILQVAESEHHLPARRRGPDRQFDVLVQEDQPGQEQLAFRRAQFETELLTSLDACLPSHESKSNH
ncbi:MAG: hypothetical protein ACLQGP_20245 [Isosphaeraceae bacterium]